MAETTDVIDEEIVEQVPKDEYVDDEFDNSRDDNHEKQVTVAGGEDEILDEIDEAERNFRAQFTGGADEVNDGAKKRVEPAQIVSDTEEDFDSDDDTDTDEVAQDVEEEPSVAATSLQADADKAEAERLEKETADKAEAERLEKEAADKAEADQLEKEAADKAEAERLEKEAADKAEAERLEKEAADKAEAERLEKEAADKAEAERLEKEAADKAEAERLEKEATDKAEAERLENQVADLSLAEQLEEEAAERLEKEAADKAEAERLEKEAAEKAEADRLAAERSAGILYRRKRDSTGFSLTLKQLSPTGTNECEGIAITAKNRNGSTSARVGLDALFSVLKHAGPADSELLETAQVMLGANEWGEKDGKPLTGWPSLWDVFAQQDTLKCFAKLCAAKVHVTTSSRGKVSIKFETSSVAKEKTIASLKRKLKKLDTKLQKLDNEIAEEVQASKGSHKSSKGTRNKVDAVNKSISKNERILRGLVKENHSLKESLDSALHASFDGESPHEVTTLNNKFHELGAKLKPVLSEHRALKNVTDRQREALDKVNIENDRFVEKRDELKEQIKEMKGEVTKRRKKLRKAKAEKGKKHLFQEVRRLQEEHYYLKEQISSLNTVRKYGTPAEIKKPRGADLHRMDPIINPSRKRKKKNRRSGGIDDTAALEADVEKLQKTRNLCFTAINNLETKLTREMKNINVQQAQFESRKEELSAEIKRSSKRIQALVVARHKLSEHKKRIRTGAVV